MKTSFLKVGSTLACMTAIFFNGCQVFTQQEAPSEMQKNDTEQ